MGLKRTGVSLARLAAALAAALIPSVATAQSNYYTEANKTVAFVGVQGNGGYVSFTTPLTATCAWNNLYFDITTDQGKAYLSVLLTARAENRPLSRVDYTITSGTCYVAIAQF